MLGKFGDCRSVLRAACEAPPGACIPCSGSCRPPSPPQDLAACNWGSQAARCDRLRRSLHTAVQNNIICTFSLFSFTYIRNIIFDFLGCKVMQTCT